LKNISTEYPPCCRLRSAQQSYRHEHAADATPYPLILRLVKIGIRQQRPYYGPFGGDGHFGGLAGLSDTSESLSGSLPL
jgi:hypothetical protein